MIIDALLSVIFEFSVKKNQINSQDILTKKKTNKQKIEVS